MASEPFEIAYAAHTASCTFLLDGEGICRRVVMRPNNHRREHARNAQRCVGAQYVASLDATATGCMVEMPRAGATMLFARVDENGRVALVRSGAVTSFESKRHEDPFADSVETSVPAFFSPGRAHVEVPAPRYDDDASERTIQLRHANASRLPAFEEISYDEEEIETEELRTSRYRASVHRFTNGPDESSERLTSSGVVDEADVEDVEDDPYQRRTLPPPILSEPARPRRPQSSPPPASPRAQAAGDVFRSHRRQR